MMDNPSEEYYRLAENTKEFIDQYYENCGKNPEVIYVSRKNFDILKQGALGEVDEGKATVFGIKLEVVE